ncbi:MAG: N-acyl homoserine lactonase family protein [Deltaproteobacteria bacterium]|nr:N-acyl homoserine lactonase family protein [Deltaproteobacteria bacterium]
MTPTYEIYALKYAGPVKRPSALMTFFKDVDKFIRMDYFFFAIRGGGETIVVDCGVLPNVARERKFPGYVNPAELLQRIDIDSRRVKNVVLSHMHYDHISGISLFPRATFFVQEKEFNFWMKNPVAKRGPFLHLGDSKANRYLARLRGTKRLQCIRGDKIIMPGIQLLLAPGHTPGLQVILVNTEKGKAIVGTDMAHMLATFQTGMPSAIMTDVVAWMKSYDKIRPKASSLDLIFPGHDPVFLEDYPKVAKDVVRLA